MIEVADPAPPSMIGGMTAPLLADPSRHDDMAARLRSLAIPRPAPPPGPAGPVPGDRRAHRRVALLAGVLLLPPGLWALAGRGPALLPEPAAPEPRAVPVPLSPPAEAASIVASGVVVALRRAVLRPEVTGRIVAIAVKAGDRVAAGQRIARLDATLAEADAALARSRAAAAETTVRIAEIELRDARQPLARLQALARRQFASDADVTAASLKVERLEAALVAARQALDAARIEAGRAEAALARYGLDAPFDGVIAARLAAPGDMVTPGGEDGGAGRGVAVLVDPEALAVDVDVAETGIGRIALGAGAGVTLDAFPDRPLAMRVATVLPEASHEKGTVTVRLAFPPGVPGPAGTPGLPAGMLPGMAAKARFTAIATAMAPAVATAAATPIHRKE